MSNEKSSRSRLLSVLSIALLLCVCGLTACNTVEGAGEDIEKAGDAVQDAAD